MTQINDAVGDDAVEDIFYGGGVAGEWLRSLDWPRRSIGAPESWPRGLRTALSICLASRYPTCVLWGFEYLYFYNDAYAPILGPRHPAALGTSFPKVWPGLWQSDIRAMVETVMSTGEASWADNVLLMVRRSGHDEERYFSLSLAPIRGDDGAVGGVLMATTETTAQVVERRRLKILNELQARSGASQSARDACTAAAQVLAANAHEFPFALLYLITPDGARAELTECVGLPPDHPASLPSLPLRAPTTADRWGVNHALRLGGPVKVHGLDGVYGYLPGGPWPESAHTALILPIAPSGQAQPVGFLISGISPRRPLDEDYRAFLTAAVSRIGAAVANGLVHEEERKRAEALVEDERAKGASFATAGHGSHAPIALFVEPIEYALPDQAAPLERQRRQRLEAAHRDSIRLIRLVSMLIDFARIEAGHADAVYEPVDLAGLTVALASSFRLPCARAGLRLAINCPPLGQAVHVDRDMWEKIVLNLLSNAFKFTFTGEIEIALARAGAGVELRVRDTGTGIPAGDLERVFERFQRVPGARARTAEGTGIGLPLVRELVKLHGGSIRAESVLGKGATLRVSLPFGKSHLPAERIGAVRRLASTALGARAYVEEVLHWLAPNVDMPLASPAAARGASVKRPRVLWADDNADMRTCVWELLERWYDVVGVADGEQALRAAIEQQPDLVLTDVMMPNLDGFGLLKALRADARTKGIPVIMLSARAGEDTKSAHIDALIDHDLSEPLTARPILAAGGSGGVVIPIRPSLAR